MEDCLQTGEVTERDNKVPMTGYLVAPRQAKCVILDQEFCNIECDD